LPSPAPPATWQRTKARARSSWECGRILHAARGPHDAGHARDAETIPDEQAVTAEQELLVAERHAELREAYSRLPPAASS
jgi:hypothetical protein